MKNINLIKKALGFKKDSVPKWYGVPHTGKAENHNIMTRNATENTSTAPTEMDSSVELYCKEMIKELLNGRTVRLGRYGTFRTTIVRHGSILNIIFCNTCHTKLYVIQNLSTEVLGSSENNTYILNH